MIASGIIGAIGLATSLAGTAMQFAGQQSAAKAGKRAEEARQKQMNLDAMRRKREIIRNSIMARSTATQNAANQGALFGTGLEGGVAQVTGTAARDTNAVNQSQDIGNQIFEANKKAYDGNTMAAFGSGLSSLGGGLVSNLQTINRVGQYYKVLSA